MFKYTNNPNFPNTSQEISYYFANVFLNFYLKKEF